MKRIDYRPGRYGRYAALGLPSVTPELRAPLAAVGAALLLAAAVWTVQALRAGEVEREGAVYERSLSAAERDAARVRAIAADVDRLHAVGERAAAIRRSGPRAADAIAVLGNRLPGGVWLTSIRTDRGAVALEGRAAQLSVLSGALDALARAPEYAATRLVAAHAQPQRRGVTYAIALEPRG